MALFLCDEELQRRDEPRVGSEDRMGRCPPFEAPAAGPFAQLELLNGAGNEPALGRTEQIWVVPGQSAWTPTVLEKMPIPALVA